MHYFMMRLLEGDDDLCRLSRIYIPNDIPKHATANIPKRMIKYFITYTIYLVIIPYNVVA